MSKKPYYEEWADTATILGFVLYPMIIVGMLMSNQYGYSEFRVRSINKFFLSFCLAYMVFFVRIDKFLQKKYLNQGLIKTDDKNNQYPKFMAVLYALYYFFSTACLPAILWFLLLVHYK